MRAERIQSILAIFIAFSLAVCPAYFQYNSIVETDFLSPHHAFENRDQENLLADKQDKTKIFVQSFSPIISFSSLFSMEKLPRLSFQIFSFDQRISVLRC